ncbi:transcription factor IIIC subunit 5 [Citrus sinensis]|uniref:Transcription factor IIIC subunit 5 n=1 Tax=Citrus sinensis TaxID=2711 RepID=A0ACB8JJS7_CITSI|nr:transcription factor IIIC subunit 5 [Citrus sinensis]
MGVIKDGKVSGNLPSNEVFAVHYPGYPSSTSRAIQTLGGSEAILKARSSKSNKLELRFRPEDPYSHPAFGEVRPCNNLLLKISKKKTSQPCDGQSPKLSNQTFKHPLHDAADVGNVPEIHQLESDSVVARKEAEKQKSEDQVNLFADIVARVSEAYHFDGMADYQHVVAVHADVARRKKRNWTEVEEPQFEKGGLIDLDEDDVMMILPPLFAPKDVPENLVLRPSVIPSSLKKEARVEQNISEIPEKVQWEEFISRDSEQWKWQMAVSKLFDERPIWPKSSINDRLLDEGFCLELHTTSQVDHFSGSGSEKAMTLAKIQNPAWMGGPECQSSPSPRLKISIADVNSPSPSSLCPFKVLITCTLFCISSSVLTMISLKFDCTPRYQRTDFRVKPPLRSYCDSNADTELKHRWKDLCAFQVFPTKCSTSLQLFELVDDYIQQEIRKPVKRTTCSLQTGWFSSHVLAAIRRRVEVRFLSVFPGTGAQKLLKNASESFEKLKRICIYKDTLKPDQEENLQINKDASQARQHLGTAQLNEYGKGEILTCDGDNREKPEAVDDEEDRIEVDDEEEDRIEVDAGEEESDADETLDMVGEDDEISLQSHSCLESNSRTYLQELFGSFSSTDVDVDKIQDNGISDGEYQIYEQDSDDSYSGDDDN